MAVKEITKNQQILHPHFYLSLIFCSPAMMMMADQPSLYFLFGDLNFSPGTGIENIFLSQTSLKRQIECFQSCRNAVKMFCKCIKVQLG